MAEMKRYIGIDYGTARIGLALSDPLGITARGLETVRWNGTDPDWAMARILELAAEYKISAFVVGLPKRTDLRPSESEDKARAFAARLAEESGLEVFLRDERLTTVMAHQYLRAGGVKKENKRNVVDQVAAEIILQDFLEEQRRKR